MKTHLLWHVINFSALFIYIGALEGVGMSHQEYLSKVELQLSFPDKLDNNKKNIFF